MTLESGRVSLQLRLGDREYHSLSAEPQEDPKRCPQLPGHDKGASL
jgi:hypothetical protein